MSYLIANAILQLVNLAVFFSYAGLDSLKWAVLFGFVIQLLPSNTFILNKNSVLASGVVLLALKLGLNYPQAFAFGILAIWPFSLLGVVPNPVAPSVVLPAAVTALCRFFGVGPLLSYFIGSFIVTKIYILLALSGKFFGEAGEATGSSAPVSSGGRRPFVSDKQQP